VCQRRTVVVDPSTREVKNEPQRIGYARHYRRRLVHGVARRPPDGARRPEAGGAGNQSAANDLSGRRQAVHRDRDRADAQPEGRLVNTPELKNFATNATMAGVRAVTARPKIEGAGPTMAGPPLDRDRASRALIDQACPAFDVGERIGEAGAAKRRPIACCY
jgi:hypothetical protein